jgi:hypothetical protein
LRWPDVAWYTYQVSWRSVQALKRCCGRGYPCRQTDKRHTHSKVISYAYFYFFFKQGKQAKNELSTSVCFFPLYCKTFIITQNEAWTQWTAILSMDFPRLNPEHINFWSQ